MSKYIVRIVTVLGFEEEEDAVENAFAFALANVTAAKAHGISVGVRAEMTDTRQKDAAPTRVLDQSMN